MTDTAVPAALRLPPDLAESINNEIGRAVRERWAVRVWERDTSLWTGDERVAEAISNRLGWLDVPAHFADEVDELDVFAQAVGSEGFTAAVLCGMGGSSLAPEVLARSFPLGTSGIRVRVLDSTDPQAVSAAQSAADPARTLYLISSKSGTTTETLSFLAHFWQLESELHHDITASTEGQHFVAITDPDETHSATGRIRQIMGLHRGMPHSDAFREMFLNPVDVGGRYSALTYVGLVPAALMDLDMGPLLADAITMAGRCRQADASNPGLWLGAAMAALARAGRDKLTFVIEPRIASFGAWVEQLIAESTGKNGTGVVPIVGEPLGAPDVYGTTGCSCAWAARADAAWSSATDAALDALAAAGHPVIDLMGDDGAGLGGEFFRWEFATAICGAGLDVNPFDEPNVTESKQNTARLLDEFHHTGSLPRLEALRTGSAADAVRRRSAPPDRRAGRSPRELRTPPGARQGERLRVACRPTSRRRRSATPRWPPSSDCCATEPGVRRPSATGRASCTRPASCTRADRPPAASCSWSPAIRTTCPSPAARRSFGTLIDAQALGDFNVARVARAAGTARPLVGRPGCRAR